MNNWQIVWIVFICLYTIVFISLPFLLITTSSYIEPHVTLNLQFKKPVFLTYHTNNPTDLFLVEEEGRIYQIKNKNEKVLFRDFTSFVNSESLEQGLLGLAFEDNSDRFYIYFTNHNNCIVLRRCSGAGVFEDLITLPAPNKFHHGGWIGFGKEGFLYVAIGDTGPQGDPLKNAQNLTKLQGKILRINVSTETGYIIPDNNPFSQTKDADIRKEIWSLGLRNPWRCSIDKTDNKIYIGNVGWTCMEEIDVAFKSAQNFGWPCMEGDDLIVPCDPLPVITLPTHSYDHHSGNLAIVGGYVYRGDDIRFKDQYLFGDFLSGCIWSFPIDKPDEVQKRFQLKNLSSFGEGPDNTIYALDYKLGIISQITNLTEF
jgi:hypothetical protein